MISSWPLKKAFYPTRRATGTDMSFRRTFTPDVGPDIDRLSSTVSMEDWSMQLIISSDYEYVKFMDWGRVELKQWIQPFIWRHPRSKSVTKWKFVGTPQDEKLGVGIYEIRFRVYRMPGIPWFAPYVLGDRVNLPLFVADYQNGIYGVDGIRGVSSDLNSVSGTYKIWTTYNDGSLARFSRATYVSGPAFPPASNLNSILGFANE